ncbi:MAG TPA: pyridoxamine 5'-phosphate oxidase family protein [Roseomonas sp.]|jgi:hypothetical protein
MALDAPSPWHAGELRLQQRAGVAAHMAEVGRRVIRDHLIEQHRLFYPQLPFVVLGAVDAASDPWATLRAHHPGFLTSPDPLHLHAALSADPADPAEAGMQAGDAIGLLGIELTTRRRNRMNGRIARRDAAGFTIAVAESFGNCPQYIQLRDATFSRDPDLPAAMAPVALDRLDAAARALIEGADTFFVASYADDDTHGRRVDVSHRGGRAGFVRLDADGGLTIPDFAGNHFFNTLGNIAANAKAGLVFVDFESGALLQMTGDAAVLLDSPETVGFAGAERLWRFHPRRILRRPQALPLRLGFAEEGWSPAALATGRWSDTGKAWRPFRVARVTEESSVIRSLILDPVDGAGIIPHQAGQHLPIRIRTADGAEPLRRSYTVSVAPSDGHYRISVKREGVVSRHLHGLRVGDVIEALAPAGGFTIDAAQHRPAVLLAAGIGVTPMLAMLRHLVHGGGPVRPTWFFHAARSKPERAFDAELAALVAAARGAVRLVRLLSDTAGAAPGDFDRAGRIDMAALRSVLPFGDYDFYLCGPPAFMQDIHDGLRDLDVADARIHAEAFGPASLRRRPGPADAPRPAPAAGPVAVTFAASRRDATWTPDAGSLLELAEAAGLRPDFDCRGGSCGTCRTRILEGAVAYAGRPSAEVAAGEALICCAQPAAGGDGPLRLDL